MEAPSVCLILQGADPSLRLGAMSEARRYGFDRILLVDAEAPRNRLDLDVEPIASNGLVDALRDRLGQSDETIMLVTAGRALRGFNWLDLVPRLASRQDSCAAVGYLAGEPAPVAALIETSAIGLLQQNDPLTRLAERHSTSAVHYRDTDVEAGAARPAVFFDRDGVINEDRGYVGDISRFGFLQDAIAGVKAANDRGALAFLVTNQSGVARGYFTEQDVADLHRHMIREMRRHGAHFDDIRICPHLPDGAVEAYRLACRCRKPAPGMLLDLMERWPVDRIRSVMIGDKASDMEAARAAGLTGMLYRGGRLADLVTATLEHDAKKSARVFG